MIVRTQLELFKFILDFESLIDDGVDHLVLIFNEILVPGELLSYLWS